MKVIFSHDFYDVYSHDPASSPGRIEAVVEEIEGEVTFVEAVEAAKEDIERVHSQDHIQSVIDDGLYDISVKAAGGAIQAAEIGLKEPCFGLIRPPGHHASHGSAWGFCFFNNMAISIAYLKHKNLIDSAFILDIDMHYGDGTEDILGDKSYVSIHNVDAHDRAKYLNKVKAAMGRCEADIIGISAGFDNHKEDWGGVLFTEDYYDIGKLVKEAAVRNNGGFFAILEGGYNHDVIGKNTLALINGMED